MSLNPTEPPAEDTPPSPEASEAPPPPELTAEQKKALEEAAEQARDLAASLSLFAAMHDSSRLKPTRGKDGSGKLEPLTIESHSFPYRLEVSPAELRVVKEILSAGQAHDVKNNPENAGTKIVLLSPSAYSRISGHLPRYIRELGGTVPGDEKEKKGPSRG